ncbi:MAG: hypothetical protein U0996_01705 [Planctomycetaceae bacterium]
MTARERQVLIVITMAAFECALIGVTYRLWLGTTEFPAVSLPGWTIDAASRQALSICLLGCCGATILTGIRQWRALRRAKTTASENNASTEGGPSFDGLSTAVRVTVGGAALFATLCAIANQHCLQAWHWLFMIVMTFAATLRPSKFFPSLMLVLAGVYLCSGLSRITLSTQPNATEMIVQAIMKFCLPANIAGDLQWIHRLAIVAACGEILAGVLLFSRRTQRMGLILACVMHLCLILALGPFGLKHHWGVILWNVCFLCLLPLVVVKPDMKQPVRFPIADAWPGICVLTFSLSGLLSISDNWPSWQLYSSRPETWELWLDSSTAEQLPVPLKKYVASGTLTGDWVVLKLDRWALDATGAPIYPEDRFLCAVIVEVLAQLKDPVFAVQIDEPEVLWWKRRTRELTSQEALDQERQRWLFPPSKPEHR